ncbi:hypothetical protein NC796_02030 [Aliifodinibius sp. S!AR15-10]|uniref:hypothetical protein n=1 Tax=Aliifodinibius sp. S!AR15-10 TaxID=2950437 RepID=UPI00285528B7|nr:hypothetical protein [Aliifodinibius sp. S!AR15-10]MDR8389898.1 hypothetical protein [Aliifodinibius sp. S!AR15-10]
MSELDSYTMRDRYDEYVEYYNQAGKKKADHIPILAEFCIIEEKTKNRADDIRENLNGSLAEADESLEKAIEESESLKTDKVEELQNLKYEIVQSIKWNIENPDYYSKREVELSDIKEKIKRFYGIVGLDEQAKLALLLFDFFTEILPRLRIAVNHNKALWFLNGKIIDENYPPILEYYNNLPEDEKNEMQTANKGLGAPLREEVPQEKIEEIVRECTKDKSSKRFIHQSGRYKGKANQSQIFEYIKTNHPVMVKGVGINSEKGIGKRHLIRRIVEALPNDMT